MKCGKCGAFINDINSVCPGCMTPRTELELNNLLVKENANDNVVMIMPENTGSENNVQDSVVTAIPEVAPVVEAVASPVVETTPVVEVVPETSAVTAMPEVAPVVEAVASPVVETTPVVEVVPETSAVTAMPEVAPVVEAVASPVVETTPVVEVVPETSAVTAMPEVAPVAEAVASPVVEATPVVEVVPETSVVTAMPEVAPVAEAVASPVIETTPVVEVVPETSAVTAMPEVAPVAETVASPVVETTPVVDAVPETSSVTAMPEVAPVAETVASPVVEATPVVDAVPETSSVTVMPEVAPVAETVASPVGTNNDIINNVVSDVAPSVANSESIEVSTPAVVEKKSKISTVIIAVVIALVIAAIGALSFYFLFYNKPEAMFKSTLTVLKNKLEDAFQTDIVPAEVKFSFNTNLKSNDKDIQDMYNKINKIYVESNVYSNVKNQQAFMDVNAKYDGKLLLGLDTYVEKNMSYIKIDDVFDKYISVDIEENFFDMADDSQNKDFINVSVGFMDAIEKSLSKEYFSKIKDYNIKINDKDVKVTANCLILDKNNIDILGKGIIDNLKNNNEFLESYARINEIENNEVISQLEDMLDSFKELDTLNFNLKIYTKGLLNEPVGFGITYDFGSTDGTLVIKDGYDVYFTENYIVVNKGEKDNLTKLIEIDIDNNKYTCDVYYDENVYSFVIGVEINENPKFNKPDVSKNVNIDELSEIDLLSIVTGIMNSDGFNAFTEDFGDVFEQLMGFGSLFQPSIPEFDIEDSEEDILENDFLLDFEF